MNSEAVKIPKSTYDTFWSLFHFSKFFGISPFHAEAEGVLVAVKPSGFFQFYSVSVVLILVLLAFKGMVNELELGEKSFRMGTDGTKYVTCTDMALVELTVVLCAVNSIINKKKFFEILHIVSEIDTAFPVKYVEKTKQIRNFAVVYGTKVGVLTIDMFIWVNAAKKASERYGLENYVFYNLTYVISIVIVWQFFLLTSCIANRLRILNDALGRISPNEKNFGDVLAFPRADHISRLTKVYLKICDAVDCINDFIGLVILVFLITSLLHLTITPYYFIVELTGRRNRGFLCGQVLWLLNHTLELLMIVEPCQKCIEEIQIARDQVCTFLSSGKVPHYKSQLEVLFKQLKFRQIEFSAFGLVGINRRLITSMATVITVYLITLIQFHNADTNDEI